MTQLVRTGYLLGTSSRRVLFNSATFALDFTTDFYKNAAGYTRTNLVANSRNVSGPGWTPPTAVTVTATADINGGNGATRLTATTSTAIKNIEKLSTPATAGSPHTFSFLAKAGTESVVHIWRSDVGYTASANLLTGATTGTTTAWPVGNGWWLVSSTFTPAGATISFRVTLRQTTAWTGTGAEYLDVDHFQFEIGSYPSSRIFAQSASASATTSVTTYISTNPADVGAMTFTRATPATSYAEDTAGNLVPFAANVPRITNKGVLIEESRTNLLLQSVSLSPSWSYAAASQGGAITAPDGTQTAYLVQDTAATSQHAVFPSAAVSITAGATYTFSVYLKAGAYSTGQVLVANNSFGNGFFVSFSLTGSGGLSSSGANGTGTYTSSSISSLGNGWYRVSVTGVVGSSATLAIVAIYLNSSGSYLGVVGNGLYPWGAQLEAGSFPTSYIPTTSATVTRAADVFYYGLSSDFTASDFSLVSQAQGIATQAGKYPAVWAVNDGTAANELQNYLATGAGAGGGNIKLTTSSVSRFDSTPSGAPSSGAITEAISKTATVRASSQGNSASSRGSWTNFGSPATSFLIGKNDIPSNGATGYPLNGYIQKLAIYPFAATDAQLQSLSSGNFLL